MKIKGLLGEFGLDENTSVISRIGSGLINHTWKIAAGSRNYILQRINDQVFKEPEAIAANIDAIGNYLAAAYPDYLFTMPVRSLKGSPLFYKPGEGYFRLFPFVEGSHTKDVAGTPDQAYEAAAQFGKFTSRLRGFDVSWLKTTIPDFHNLSLRYRQFLEALQNGNPERIRESAPLAAVLKGHGDLVARYEKIIRSTDFTLRVTHHDTKISNVLFDENDKGICVIDLDTLMPGYFISDLGDMMRTYLSPVSEEETDFGKIEIRDAFYEALVRGYHDEMKDVLTGEEKEHFFYAGTFMIYMQALRFLTDYINNDIYYGARYPGHNLVRANNQALLLQRLLEKKDKLVSVLRTKNSYTK